ncbi:MAG: hypothetical protein V5A23_05585 [Halobacteriales archaeon]
MNRAIPYVLAGVGLVGGLALLLFAPFPVTGLNYLVGGAGLGISIASVAYLIAEGSAPGNRGPDF